MVAEKKGRIRFYNLETRLPVMSLDCPKPPLLAADWSLANPLTVGAVAGGSWFMWDTSRSSQPCDSHDAHQTVANGFRWCSTSDGVFATISAGGQVKIHHYGHKMVRRSSFFEQCIVSWEAFLFKKIHLQTTTKLNTQNVFETCGM